MSLLFGKEVRSWRLTSSSVQNWGWTRSLREKVWSTPGLSPGGAGGGGALQYFAGSNKGIKEGTNCKHERKPSNGVGKKESEVSERRGNDQPG